MPYTGEEEAERDAQRERANIVRMATHLLAQIREYRHRHPEHAHLDDDEILELLRD